MLRVRLATGLAALMSDRDELLREDENWGHPYAGIDGIVHTNAKRERGTALLSGSAVVVDGDKHMLSAVEAELNAHPLPFEFEVRLPSARDPEGLPGGASLVFQLIHHCPWCGERLPESVRHAWFDRLDALGLEPEDELPDELAADDWWKRELDS